MSFVCTYVLQGGKCNANVYICIVVTVSHWHLVRHVGNWEISTYIYCVPHYRANFVLLLITSFFLDLNGIKNDFSLFPFKFTALWDWPLFFGRTTSVEDSLDGIHIWHWIWEERTFQYNSHASQSLRTWDLIKTERRTNLQGQIGKDY